MSNQRRDVSMAHMVDAELQGMVRGAAEPWSPGESVKAAIRRAARALGMKPRRAEQAWYRQPAAWRAAEVETIRARHRDVLLARLERTRREAAAIEAMLAGDAR